MDKIKSLIKDKMCLCLNSISNLSSNGMDRNEAEAVEHLAKALSYINQIKEEK